MIWAEVRRHPWRLWSQCVETFAGRKWHQIARNPEGWGNALRFEGNVWKCAVSRVTTKLADELQLIQAAGAGSLQLEIFDAPDAKSGLQD